MAPQTCHFPVLGSRIGLTFGAPFSDRPACLRAPTLCCKVIYTDSNCEILMRKSLIREPSAALPIAISLTLLGMVLLVLAIHGGAVHETDEGTAAHIFQMGMAAEVPVIGFFALKWLPEKPREAITVLAIQGVAILAVCALVFFFTD